MNPHVFVREIDEYIKAATIAKSAAATPEAQNMAQCAITTMVMIRECFVRAIQADATPKKEPPEILEKMLGHLKTIADCTCEYGADRKPYMRVETPNR